MAIHDICSKYGTLQNVNTGSRFKCDEVFSFWYVKSGAVDVFLRRNDTSDNDRSLYHFFRVSEGELFSTDFSPHEGNWELIARNCSETEVYHCLLPSFKMLNATESLTLSVLIDEFINKITKVVNFEKIPLNTIEIVENIDLMQDDTITVSRFINWISLSEGVGYFNGDDGAKLGQDQQCFPLTPHSWVRLSAATDIKVYTTLQILQMDNFWSSLKPYYLHLVYLFLIKIDNEILYNNIILYDKVKNNRLSMKCALGELKDSYDLTHHTSEKVTNSGDPVFLVCQRLAEYYDLSLRSTSAKLSSHNTFAKFKSIMNHSKIFYRKVYLPNKWEKSEHGPIFGVEEKSQKPVALIATNGKDYQSQTENGYAKLGKYAFAIYRSFNNVILSLKDVVKFGLAFTRHDIRIIFACFTVTALLALIPPILMQIIFDNIIVTSDRGRLFDIGLVMLVTIVVTGMFEMTKRFTLLRFEAKFDSQIQAAFWARILRLPILFFRQFTPGELVSRITRLIDIRFALSGPLLHLSMNMLFSAMSWLLLFYYSAFAATIVLLFLAVIVGCYILLMRARLRYEKLIVTQQDKLFGMLGEFFTAIAKIHLTGSEFRVFFHWSHAFSVLQENLRKSLKLSSIISSIIDTAPLLAFGIAYAALAWTWYQSNTLSTGYFLAFNAVLAQLVIVIFELLHEVNRIIEQIPCFERAKIFIQTLPEQTEELPDPGDINGNIEISNVSFKYPQMDRWILKNINIHIEPGEYVAIVGPSGSGKSTLIRLLLHFENPTEGGIYFDNNDINQIDMESLRQQMGVVLQNDQLIPGDLYSNIAGANDLSLKEAWNIAEKVDLAEDIRNMPMQMHTMINMEGVGLSGGQRERLLIARAIASQPKILILDEATRALDNKTQKHVITQLNKMKMTRIVIAHRLSTLQDVDRIYVMDQGQIVEFGTYQQLIDNNNLFSRLVKHQTL